MRINVGSKNPVKIEAVLEVIKNYNFLAGAEVEGLDIASEVDGQPKSLEETVRGAKNRARNAFKNCDLSVGLESGLIKIPDTKSGYMDTTVCAIYDGRDFHLGSSCCFEYPPKAVELVFNENIEIDQACFKIGITEDIAIGKAEGLIGLLTKNRVTRKDYTKQAVQMALIHLENKELYQNI